MGNCIRKESSAQWGGEDWGSIISDEIHNGATAMKVVGEERKKAAFHPSAATGTAVKIKITKKQLEEVLSKMDIQGLSPQQLLSQLINFSDGFDHKTHIRSWRPRLQSIPEAEFF